MSYEQVLHPRSNDHVSFTSVPTNVDAVGVVKQLFGIPVCQTFFTKGDHLTIKLTPTYGSWAYAVISGDTLREGVGEMPPIVLDLCKIINVVYKDGKIVTELCKPMNAALGDVIECVNNDVDTSISEYRCVEPGIMYDGIAPNNTYNNVIALLNIALAYETRGLFLLNDTGKYIGVYALVKISSSNLLPRDDVIVMEHEACSVDFDISLNACRSLLRSNVIETALLSPGMTLLGIFSDLSRVLYVTSDVTNGFTVLVSAPDKHTNVSIINNVVFKFTQVGGKMTMMMNQSSASFHMRALQSVNFYLVDEFGRPIRRRIDGHVNDILLHITLRGTARD